MSALAAYRDRLRSSRRHLIRSLAALPETDLTRRWPYRGSERTDLRDGLLWLVDDEQATLVAIAEDLAARGWQPGEARRILGQAEISQGELLGLLVGLGDDALDRVPAPGEWPLRMVLAHLIVTERRYLQRTIWHVAEARAGRPTRAEPAAGVVEPLASAERYAAGDLDQLSDRLAEVRAATLAGLAELTSTDLDAPTSWAGFDVDIRFRLHRFAAHEREHTVQVAKTLQGIGWQPSEPQRLLALGQAMRGRLLALLIGLPDAQLIGSVAGQQRVADRLEALLQREVAMITALDTGSVSTQMRMLPKGR